MDYKTRLVFEDIIQDYYTSYGAVASEDDVESLAVFFMQWVDEVQLKRFLDEVRVRAGFMKRKDMMRLFSELNFGGYKKNIKRM